MDFNPIENALRKALEFYANKDNWIDVPSIKDGVRMVTPKAIPVIHRGPYGSPCDCGDTARSVLAIVYGDEILKKEQN